MQKYGCNIVVSLMIVLFVVNQGLAGELLFVTDNTPGGNYIVGDGTTIDQKKPGIEIELYRMVADNLGLQLNIKRLPWKLCLQQLEHNLVDGIFPASFKADRLKIGHYPMKKGKIDSSRKTRNNAYYLYTMKDSRLSWSGSDFTGLTGTIGVPSGWAIVEELKNKGIPIKEVPIHKNSPDLLILKRLQGFICLEPVFDFYINSNPDRYQDIVKTELPIWEKPYYLMLSRQFVENNPDAAKNIWNAIREIKGTEAFARIVSKYLD